MKKKLGEILVASGAVAPEDVESALADQSAGEPARLGDILLSLGKLTPTQLGLALAEQYELPFIELPRIPADVLGTLPLPFQRQYRLVPFAVEGEMLCVAVADPAEAAGLATVDRPVKLHIAAGDEIDAIHAITTESGISPPVPDSVAAAQASQEIDEIFSEFEDKPAAPPAAVPRVAPSTSSRTSASSLPPVGRGTSSSSRSLQPVGAPSASPTARSSSSITRLASPSPPAVSPVRSPPSMSRAGSGSPLPGPGVPSPPSVATVGSPLPSPSPIPRVRPVPSPPPSGARAGSPVPSTAPARRSPVPAAVPSPPPVAALGASSPSSPGSRKTKSDLFSVLNEPSTSEAPRLGSASRPGARAETPSGLWDLTNEISSTDSKLGSEEQLVAVISGESSPGKGPPAPSASPAPEASPSPATAGISASGLFDLSELPDKPLPPSSLSVLMKDAAPASSESFALEVDADDVPDVSSESGIVELEAPGDEADAGGTLEPEKPFDPTRVLSPPPVSTQSSVVMGEPLSGSSSVAPAPSPPGIALGVPLSSGSRPAFPSTPSSVVVGVPLSSGSSASGSSSPGDTELPDWLSDAAAAPSPAGGQAGAAGRWSGALDDVPPSRLVLAVVRALVEQGVLTEEALLKLLGKK